MERKSFQDYLWGTAVSSGMWIFGIIVGLCGLAGYFFAPDIKIPLKYLLAALFIIFPFIYIPLKTAYMIYEDFLKKISSSPLTPKIIKVKTPSKFYDTSIAEIITEPTPTLTHGTIVSIYFLVSEFEELIALGEVINVQQDDKIVHVLITHDYDLKKYQDNIMKNDKETLEKIVLKSAIPSFILSGALNFG